jgi:predicted dehydrogenase
MAREKLKWGLLGTARINRALIPVLRESPRNTLDAVASRAADRAEAYAREWSIPRAFGTYDALLQDPAIDVVYIALPNGLHVDWTIRALEAGKHELCEKPLALTVEDVDRIADASRRTGRLATEAFMYRHHPLTLKVEELVRAGALGPLRLIRGAFTFTLTREGDVRWDPALGGGSLWDVGCYPVSYACLLADAAPTDVAGWQELSPSGVDIGFAGILRFRDDLIATFDCGFRAPFRAEMEVVGSDALLRVDHAFKTGPRSRLTLVRDDEPSDVPFDNEPPYIGEVDDLASAILDGQPLRVTLAESRRTVGAIQALYRSCQG